MGKNKGKSQQKGKDSVLFKTVGTKITKNKKTKPVNINLKKLKHLTKSKTEEVDQTWKDVREIPKSSSSSTTQKKDGKAKPATRNIQQRKPPPNVDQELKNFAAL
ncbi:uncharacterized protein LOC106168589 [Lingula anatina]|uniref:Uncharacterized protein LOC106168589 n=1 Tax=Lingula anatina TaxID=7574 RepID=A0A1S3IYS7_LINAN|nr:uncharacterized protein LOC106168589 [Lingula anatina]|eukprot:XP_013403168.1 uncharacterized protein LOC106168589 [Lingula anatina]